MNKFIYLKYFAISVLSLFVGICFFIVGYLNKSLLSCALAIAFLIAFIFLCTWSNKKMTLEGDYSLLQAYLLYLSCCLKKVFVTANQLTETEKKEIIKIAKKFDLPKNFDNTDYLKLFRMGYKVSLQIKNKKHQK